MKGIVCQFECSGVAEVGIARIGPRKAALVSRQLHRRQRLVGAIGDRDKIDRLAVRFERDGLGRPAVVRNPAGSRWSVVLLLMLVPLGAILNPQLPSSEML